MPRLRYVDEADTRIIVERLTATCSWGRRLSFFSARVAATGCKPLSLSHDGLNIETSR